MESFLQNLQANQGYIFFLFYINHLYRKTKKLQLQVYIYIYIYIIYIYIYINELLMLSCELTK